MSAAVAGTISAFRPTASYTNARDVTLTGHDAARPAWRRRYLPAAIDAGS